MIIKVGIYDVLIDDEDHQKIASLTWRIDKGIYRRCGKLYAIRNMYIDGKQRTIGMHRFVIGCTYKDGMVVDHINGDTLDNRKCNLRICSSAENGQNCKVYTSNTSGYKGVSYHTRDNKYQASIQINKVQKFLGYFTTPEDAYAAYCEASKKYHGEFGRVE